MKVTPTQPTQTTQQQKPKHLKPTDKPTFEERLLLALANRKEQAK